MTSNESDLDPVVDLIRGGVQICAVFVLLPVALLLVILAVPVFVVWVVVRLILAVVTGLMPPEAHSR